MEHTVALRMHLVVQVALVYVRYQGKTVNHRDIFILSALCLDNLSAPSKSFPVRVVILPNGSNNQNRSHSENLAELFEKPLSFLFIVVFVWRIVEVSAKSQKLCLLFLD